jgi:hypothetical protein
MNKSKLSYISFLTVVLAIIFSAPVQARNAQDEVRAKLLIAGSVFIEQGFQLTHEIIWGQLTERQSETISLRLDGNKEYIIFGVCDNDCYNVNIDFYDASGRRLAYNHAHSDAPYIVVQKGNSGLFYIHMTMVRCASSYSCNYGVGVFGRY